MKNITDIDDLELSRFEFSYPLHKCKMCGLEVYSVYDCHKNFHAEAGTRTGRTGRCRHCQHEYTKELKEHTNKKPKVTEELKIRRRLNKIKYDIKNGIRMHLKKKALAYVHIANMFAKQFENRKKESEMVIMIPFDDVIKSPAYFKGEALDLITYYLEKNKQNYNVYLIPHRRGEKFLKVKLIS